MRQIISRTTIPLLFAAASAVAQSIDAYNPMPLVYPTSISAQADGKIIIVGNFSSVGTTTMNGVARLNTDGSVDTTFANPVANGEVKTLAVQPDGKVLIGGDFTAVGGQARHSLARLNGDGSLDATFADPDFNAAIFALALQPDGKVLAGGGFTLIGSHAQNYFARIDANGGFDASFADPLLCCDPLVSAIALQSDGDVLIGGAFSEAGGVSDHSYFARFSSAGVYDPDFPAPSVGILPASIVVAPDGSIYVGAAGTDTVVKLSSAGALIAGFAGAPTDGSIRTLALQPNGKIVIGGTFETIGGQPRHALARLNADGSLDASFADLNFSFDAGNPNSFIYGVAEQADGRIVAIGNFTLVNGQPRQYMARVTTGDYATSTLVVRPDGASVDVTWFRLGDGPELTQPPTLLHSTDGVNFSAVGPMTYAPGGWHASANYDVRGARFYLKVIGATGNGANNASPGLVESDVYSSDTIFADGFE